jgi:glycosyltransferase involved in cell wall biosynthesis
VNLLKRTLESLIRQTTAPDRFEIIVVDDGSDDGTQELVLEMSMRHSLIRVVSTEKNEGASRARNLGLAVATGDYVLFTDDDCIAKNNWVEIMCCTLDREPIVAGAVESPKSGYIKVCHNIAHFNPFMPGRKSDSVDFLAGANMGFQRIVIEELGGFDDEMILAGDMQLCLRARSRGYQPYLNQEAGVVHDPDYISLAGAVKSSYAHAATTILLRNEYRSLLRTPRVLKYPMWIRLASPLIALSVTSKIYLRNPRLLSSFWTVPFVFFLKLVWCFGAARGLNESRKGSRLVKKGVIDREVKK